MIEIEFYMYLLLFVAAFVAGFIDSIAGGGGLIATPALLLAGLPPLNALATNKIQAVFGSSTAAINYRLKINSSIKVEANKFSKTAKIGPDVSIGPNSIISCARFDKPMIHVRPAPCAPINTSAVRTRASCSARCMVA